MSRQHPPQPPPSPPGAGLEPVAGADGATPSPGTAAGPPQAPAADRHQLFGASRVVPGDPDEVVAGRAASGDVQAFEILVDRYQGLVFNLTFRMTGNWQDARELTQDVFVRIWRGLGGFDTRQRFFSWMYRIAIHACLNHRRSAGRQEALEWELESKEEGPDRQAETAELERDVHAALARLPDGDRQLLVLRHFLDHSYEEIAEIVGVPAPRVKSRLFSARDRLRRELKSRGVRP